MKTTKTHKLLTLVLIAFLSIAFAFGAMNFIAPKTVRAASAHAYFSYVQSENANSEIVFENDNVKIPMKNEDVVKISQRLVVDDFELELIVPTGVKKLTLTVEADSFEVNGNKSAELDVNNQPKFDKTIENELVLDFENGQATLNDALAVSVALQYDVATTINLSLVDNFLNAIVNATTVNASTNDYYKLADYDKVVANIELGVECDGEIDLQIVSVSQKSSDANYKQTFVLQDGKLKDAYPVLVVSNAMAKFDNSGRMIVLNDTEYTVSFSQYSFTANSKSLEIQAEDAWVSDKALMFAYRLNTANVEKSLKVVDKDDDTIIYAEYTLIVSEELADGEGTAPTYSATAEQIENYKEVVKQATIAEYKDGKPIYVRLGASQSFKIPSLKNLVSDDTSSYENLTYKVFYKTPTLASSTSGMNIPLASAGWYEFYVVFADEMGNEMKQSDFYITDVNDPNSTIDGTYIDYVFRFYVEDNAPISVKAAKTQGNGYKGVAYNATGFTIEASSYEAQYTLYYSATVNEVEGVKEYEWVEIPKASAITDTDYDKDGFNYDAIQAIAYDGNLAFTPDRLGYYMIECTISSSTSARVTETAQSAVIEVLETPKVVVAAEDNWWLNNVVSIVLLGVGTLALIGFIVLLCIKPKEQVATTSAPIKRKSKKK